MSSQKFVSARTDRIKYLVWHILIFFDGAIMTAEWLVTLSAVACLLMFVAVLFGGAYILAAVV